MTSDTVRITPFPIESCISGTVTYPPGGTYGPVVYRQIQIILLHSGSMDIRLDGKTLRILPGHAVLIRPGQDVYIAFDRGEPSWHRWVTMTPRTLDDGLRESLSRLPVSLALSWRMNQLVDLAVAAEKDKGIGVAALHETLALAALQLYASDSAKRSAYARQSAMAAVKSLIHERYAEEWTLPEIARAANVSASHLGRLFREQEGMSPMRYLWRYRVEQGIQLLRTTGLSIGEISELCGFKTPFHFARWIKLHTGKTASALRAMHWDGSERRSANPYEEEP